MSKTILFLTNAYPDFDSSYRGIFIKKMASLLQQDGYSITIVTPKIYKNSRFFENQEGIKVYRFPFFAGDRLLIEYRKVPYLRMILYYVSGFLLTLLLMIKSQYQLIHVHWAIPTGLIGVLIGPLFKKPVIVTIHGSDYRIAIENSGFLKKIFIFVCNRASHLNCVSEVQKNDLEQLGVSDKKITVSPMGVDADFWEKGKYKKVYSGKQSYIIISNRNLLPIYNVSFLIKAIPIILNEEPKAQFIIAGDGEEKESIEKEVKNLELDSSVKLIGRIPHQEMPELLAQSDIYVSTSLYDGTSVSLLEAMALGCFPVVSDISSNREWIRDGENGFLFPVNDEKILAKKILDAIHDKELLNKARKWNQSIVKEKALWPIYIKKIKEIYETQLLFKKADGK